MGTKEKQPPCEHDFAPSLSEPGVDECQWPGCGATRESPVTLELPSPALVEAVMARAA